MERSVPIPRGYHEPFRRWIYEIWYILTGEKRVKTWIIITVMCTAWSAVISCEQSPVRSPQSPVPSRQSPVPSLQSAVRSPQSAVPSPHSAFHSPQYVVRSPQSTVHNSKSAVQSLQSVVYVLYWPCNINRHKQCLFGRYARRHAFITKTTTIILFTKTTLNRFGLGEHLQVIFTFETMKRRTCWCTKAILWLKQLIRYSPQ